MLGGYSKIYIHIPIERTTSTSSYPPFRWISPVGNIYSCSFDLNLSRQDDPLFDGDALCNGHKVCLDCNDFCQEDTEYPFADWLFDLEADPRESNNVIHEYPEVRLDRVHLTVLVIIVAMKVKAT